MCRAMLSRDSDVCEKTSSSFRCDTMFLTSSLEIVQPGKKSKRREDGREWCRCLRALRRWQQQHNTHQNLLVSLLQVCAKHLVADEVELKKKKGSWTTDMTVQNSVMARRVLTEEPNTYTIRLETRRTGRELQRDEETAWMDERNDFVTLESRTCLEEHREPHDLTCGRHKGEVRPRRL